MSRVRSSVLFSFADKYIAQMLLVVTTAVMARVLTPAETGLFVVANSVVLLADNLRTFGVGVYIVQVPDLREATLRSAFTLTLILSLGIMAGIYWSADAIAGFYDQDEIAHLLRLASLAFLVVPLATPIVALLQRELRFRTLALLNVAMATTSCLVTVTLGFAGAGPASYVYGYLASSVVLAVLAILVRPQLGMFRPSLVEARRMLSFGAVSSSVTVLNMAYEMLPRLAFGKLLPFEAVGLYARAATICQLPDRAVVAALQPVVLPALAAQARSGGSLKASYLRGHALMSAVQWPTLIMLALLARPVVEVMLGQQWIEAAPLVRMISLAMMALAPSFMTFPILVAAGRVQDTLWMSLISLPPSVLLLIGASTFGLEAVAASMFIVAPMQMAVAFSFVRRAIGVTVAEMKAASRDSMLLALGTALIPVLIVSTSDGGFALGWIETAGAVLGGAAGWLVTLVLVRHPIRSELYGVWRLLTQALQRGRPAVAASGAE